MKSSQSSFAQLSDEALLAATRRLAECERHATADLIAVLMEVDTRRLYLGEGCSSLFTYCTQVLHLSEHAAYHRIEAARAGRRFPEILERLAEGSLTLTAVGLLASHLTAENHTALCDAARFRSKREVEQLIVAIKSQPATPSSVRKLPVTAPSESTPPAVALTAALESVQDDVPILAPPTSIPRPVRPATTTPLAPDRYKVQFTVNRETYDKLRRVQDLLRHTVPNGDPAVVFDRALTLLLADLEKKKCAVTARPRAALTTAQGSRHIPAAVRREVWNRDGGRCALIGTSGRCAETGFLEFHHVVPYAEGGAASMENIQLRCAAHNKYEAEHIVPSRVNPRASPSCS